MLSPVSPGMGDRLQASRSTSYSSRVAELSTSLDWLG